VRPVGNGRIPETAAIDLRRTCDVPPGTGECAFTHQGFRRRDLWDRASLAYDVEQLFSVRVVRRQVSVAERPAIAFVSSLAFQEVFGSEAWNGTRPVIR